MEMCASLWNIWRESKFCSSYKSSAFPYKSSSPLWGGTQGVSTFSNYLKISDFFSLLNLWWWRRRTWGPGSVTPHLVAGGLNHFLGLCLESALSSWSLLAFWVSYWGWVMSQCAPQTPWPLNCDLGWHRPSHNFWSLYWGRDKVLDLLQTMCGLWGVSDMFSGHLCRRLTHHG